MSFPLAGEATNGDGGMKALLSKMDNLKATIFMWQSQRQQKLAVIVMPSYVWH